MHRNSDWCFRISNNTTKPSSGARGLVTSLCSILSCSVGSHALEFSRDLFPCLVPSSEKIPLFCLVPACFSIPRRDSDLRVRRLWHRGGKDHDPWHLVSHTCVHSFTYPMQSVTPGIWQPEKYCTAFWTSPFTCVTTDEFTGSWPRGSISDQQPPHPVCSLWQTSAPWRWLKSFLIVTFTVAGDTVARYLWSDWGVTTSCG